MNPVELKSLQRKLLDSNNGFLKQDSNNKRFVCPSVHCNKALEIAACKGKTGIVKLLLKDPCVDPSDQNNIALQGAVLNGHYNVVQALLEDPRVDPSVKNSELLYEAIRNRYYDIAMLLMRDPRTDLTVDNYNIVCLVAEYGTVELMQLLLSFKKNPCICSFKDPPANPENLGEWSSHI